MDQTAISNITAKQREFYNTGVTLDVRYRIDALKRLRKTVTEHEDEIAAALREDLGKSATEGYMRCQPYNKVWDALIRIFMS